MVLTGVRCCGISINGIIDRLPRAAVTCQSVSQSASYLVILTSLLAFIWHFLSTMYRSIMCKLKYCHPDLSRLALVQNYLEIHNWIDNDDFLKTFGILQNFWNLSLRVKSGQWPNPGAWLTEFHKDGDVIFIVLMIRSTIGRSLAKAYRLLLENVTVSPVLVNQWIIVGITHQNYILGMSQSLFYLLKYRSWERQCS